MKQRTTYYGVLYATVLCLIALAVGTVSATATREPTLTPSPETPQPTETAVSSAVAMPTASPVTATPTALPLSAGREASRDAIIRAYEILFGMMAYGTGNLIDVVANLDEAVKLAPDWWVPHWAFAEFYTLAETFDWAKRSADRAIALGGDAESRGRLYYLRMNAEAQLGDDKDFAAIAEDAKVFIYRQPNSASGYHFLGYAQRKLELYEDAEATLRHGLSLDPSHQSMTTNLVRVLEAQPPSQIARGDLAVMRILNRALNSTGDIGILFSDALNAAKTYDGDLAYVYVAQATHYLITMGMFVDGMEAARAGVEAEPDWALSHMTLGRGFTVDNDYESAVPHFDRAFELDPTLYELHRFRLRAYGYTGQRLSPAETALFFSLTSRHAIPWQLDPSGTTYLPYLDLGAYEMPFEGVEGQIIRIRARAAFNSISNPVLLIVGPDGTPLAAAHNNSGDASRQIAALTFTVPADGSYTLMVGDVHPRTAAQVDFEVAP